MKIILEIKFVHKKIKSWVIVLPFLVHEWVIKDVIEITNQIDEFFKNTGRIKIGNMRFPRSAYVETWRVYMEDS